MALTHPSVTTLAEVVQLVGELVLTQASLWSLSLECDFTCLSLFLHKKTSCHRSLLLGNIINKYLL